MEATKPMKTLKNPVVDYVCYFLCKFLYSCLTCVELYYFSAFLTDTAVLSIAIIGTIQMVTTVVDFIFAFFYGVIMEKVGGILPWGRTRSWLVIAPPIATVTFAFALIRVSESETVSAVVIILGFLISHVAWSVGECSMNAQTGNMTDDLNQQAQMSINLGRGTMGSSLVFGIIAGFFLNTLFAGSPRAYFYMCFVFGVFYWIGYLLIFWRSAGTEPTKEEYMAKKKREKLVAEVSTRSATVVEGYKAIITSRNGLCILAQILFSYLYSFIGSGLMFYYFNYTLDGSGLPMGTFMSVRGLVALLGGIFFVPLLLKLAKGDKRMCQVYTTVILIVGLIIPYLPMLRYNGMFYTVEGLIVSFLGAGATMMQVGMLTDVGNELTYKLKKDLTPFTVSFLMIPLKLSLILRSAIITIIIGATGYVAGEEITQGMRDGFATGYLLISAIACLISLVFTLLFNLKAEAVQQMVIANNEARAEEEAKINAYIAEHPELGL